MSDRELDQVAARLGALLDRQDQGRDLAALRAEYGEDLPRLVEREFGARFFPKQQEIVTAFQAHPFVAVLGANGTGKDFVAARLAVAEAALGRLVLCTAPTERQLRHVFMRECFAVWQRAQLPGEFYELGWRISRGDPAGIIGFVSNDVSRHSGFHSPGGVTIIGSEAQGIERGAWEGLISNLTGERSRMLVTANPLVAEGPLYNACHAPHWHIIRIAAADHPNIQQGREVIPGGITVRFVETIANEFGVGSGQYRSRVLAEWPEDATEALCRRAWIDRAVARFRTAPPFDPQQPATLGLDMARLGGDSCALAVRQRNVIYEVITWRGLDTQESLARVLVELRRLGYPIRIPGVPFRAVPEPHWTLVLDEIGIGAGPFDQLRRGLPGLTVVGFNAGRKPSGAGEHQFVNERIEVAWHLRRLLEQGTVALPPDVRLADELCITRYKTEPTSGRLLLQPKDEVRSALGRSPDAFDAVCLAFAADFTDAWMLDLHRAVNDGTRAFW